MEVQTFGQGREPEGEKEGVKKQKLEKLGAGRRWGIFFKESQRVARREHRESREKDRKDDMEGVGKVFEEMGMEGKGRGFLKRWWWENRFGGFFQWGRKRRKLREEEKKGIGRGGERGGGKLR